MITREKLLELINDAGLSEHASQLLDKAQPAIHLKLQKVEGETEVALGQSKAGGSPDLPPDTEWPRWKDRPLTFMMQFRLSDVAPFDSEHHLPDHGLLYFFYAADSQPWGFDPADRGGGKVIFVADETAPLVRTPHPVAPGEFDEIGPLPACTITFSRSLTLPTHGHAEFAEMGLDDDQWDRFWTLRSSLEDTAKPMHQLLGYPFQIQGDMQLECQLTSHGLYTGDSSGYKDPRRQDLEPGAKDWRLLLQIDSDEDNLGVMWGDDGMIYYWVQTPALQARNFDNCWLVLQCY